MARFAGLFAMLLFIAACAMVTDGPRLSEANARRIADAEVGRKVDLRQYDISGIRYSSTGGYWSVDYRRRRNRREGFTVRVSDKMEKASNNQRDAGIFEGGLIEEPDYH
jgi:hypothetical protein